LQVNNRLFLYRLEQINFDSLRVALTNYTGIRTHNDWAAAIEAFDSFRIEHLQKM